MQIKQRKVLFVVLVLISIQQSSEAAAEDKKKNQDATSKGQQQQQQQQRQQTTQLDCQPGELRYFNYESSTRVWGSTNQQVQLRASLRLRCMESPLNSTLKYMAEILSLEPVFQINGPDNNNNKLVDNLKKGRVVAGNGPRAEPVFEEVGKTIELTANRMKRSLSGWFNQTWTSVKDFFVNIFNSGERSSVSRDQAYSESGIDIANQCKSKKKPAGGLPIDDSVFDDLEPKYYIGASSDPLVGTAYVFDGGDDDDIENDADANLSFFDEPKSRNRIRSKRAVSDNKSSKKAARSGVELQENPDVADKQLKLPFIFFQSRLGKIIEIRFSPEETDVLVKNFKRHLCDLFATNLDKSKNQLNEISPIGQHTTKYLLDSSHDSSAIKQSLIKSANLDTNKESTGNKQLVRVLALQANLKQQIVNNNNFHYDDGDDDEPAGISVQQSRDPSQSDGRPGDSLSVLRSINSTSSIKLNSRTISPDIERLQIQVEQVQQISDGRMTQSAGQLGVSLLQQLPSNQKPSASSNNNNNNLNDRFKRSLASDVGGQQQQQVQDIADLLQVSSSYSVQLVPLSKLGNFSTSFTGVEANTIEQPVPTFVTLGDDSDDGGGGSSNSRSKQRPKRASSQVVEISKNSTQLDSGKTGNSNNSSGSSSNSNNKDHKNRQKREPIVIRPSSAEELEKSLRELRSAESKLQLTRSSSLLPESSPSSSSSNSVSGGGGSSSGGESSTQLGNNDNSMVATMQTRLELIRDQIQMRLNEEFMRNRLREKTLDAIRQHIQAVQDPSMSSSMKLQQQQMLLKKQQLQPNSLGLGLTQLILDSGITSKHKGSVYSTLEEALELESQLEEDSLDGSVSKLLRETIRLDKLKQHCKSSIATLSEIRTQSARLEMKAPFGEDDDDVSITGDMSSSSSLEKERFAKVVENLENKNRKRLEQCKQVVQLMLRVGDKKVADLIIELIDECNSRLISASKDEELGFGPASKYYRSLRQQFIELLANINKPNDLLLDRLMSRLQMASLSSRSSSSASASNFVVEPTRKRTFSSSSSNSQDQPEFTYVNSRTSGPNNDGGKYNKSLLRDEDYALNNNDVLGSLVMTLTNLASRPTIKQEKRVQLAEKLLISLKSTTCSPFEGPDLDILESMGNFHQPIDEIVGKIVHLAKKCQTHDQYLVACVHGLRGQLNHPISQRYFIELLKSSNISCLVKSEIVLTLVDVILIEDLKALTQPLLSTSISAANDISPSPDRSRSKDGSKWPASGLNRLDETLIELIDPKGANSRAQDRRCLTGLVKHYLSKKHQSSNEQQSSGSTSSDSSNQKKSRRESRRRGMGMRFRRAVINDDQFWDEAQCKRWLLPNDSALNSSSPIDEANLLNSMANDLIDEIDDNSIAIALANSKKNQQRAAKKNQQLLEREAENNQEENNNSNSTKSTTATVDSFIRKRHKCTASKKYGPKNAEAILRAEIVNDLIGSKDENKFLARFRLGTNFLGNRIDVGRMYLWHQKQTTRAHVNILGKSLWDSSQSCTEKAPHHLLYMPLFDFNLWLVKVSVGLKLQSEMGFFSNCPQQKMIKSRALNSENDNDDDDSARKKNDQLELFPTISLRASGEASAKFVMARAGMSLASQYGYQGNIRVSRQPNSCMTIHSAHQPMNVTFSSWFQLWDSDCHYWGSRNRAEPQATRWRLAARQPTVWLDDECLLEPRSNNNQTTYITSSSSLLSRRSPARPSSTISP